MSASYELPRNRTSDFMKMIKPFADDLRSLFTIYEEKVEELVEKAAREEWSAEKLVREIDKLIGAKADS